MASLGGSAKFVKGDRTLVMINRPADLWLALPALMDRAELSSKALAYAIDVPEGYVRAWTDSQRPVPIDRLADLAFVFGLSIRQLLAVQDAERVAAAWNVPVSPEMVRSRLLAAGMLRVSGVRPPAFELCCLSCGRGTNSDGTASRVRRLPHHIERCQFCGGSMLANECLSGKTEGNLFETDERIAA